METRHHDHDRNHHRGLNLGPWITKPSHAYRKHDSIIIAHVWVGPTPYSHPKRHWMMKIRSPEGEVLRRWLGPYRDPAIAPYLEQVDRMLLDMGYLLGMDTSVKVPTIDHIGDDHLIIRTDPDRGDCVVLQIDGTSVSLPLQDLQRACLVMKTAGVGDKAISNDR